MNTKFKLFIVLLLISILFLSSCISQEPEINKRYIGYDGINVKFSKSTPDEVYENTNFYTRLILSNEGTHTITSDDPGYISIVTDELFLQYNKNLWDDNRREVFLEGKSQLFPTGESTILDLPEFTVIKIPGAIQHPEANLYFSLCYPYETIFSHNVCLDFDPYDIDEREKVCKADVVSGSGGQGAPISVMSVESLMTTTSNTITPQFLIELENKGKGVPAYSDSDDCKTIANTGDNWNKVKISGSVSVVDLICDNDVVKFINNKAKVRCVANNSFGAATNFLTPITIRLDYDYIQSISTKFDIIRTSETELYSYTANEDCVGKSEGSFCGDTSINSGEYMVCDEHQQCVDRCSYCSQHPGTTAVDCGPVNPDFGCFCSALEVKALPTTKYIKGFCEYKECCDSGQREAAIAYAEKDHYYELLFSDYNTLSDKVNLKSLFDYRFKPIYTNSNKYCRILLFGYDEEGLLINDAIASSALAYCSSSETHLEYNFTEEDINKKYVVQMQIFDSPDSERPIKFKNSELTIKPFTKLTDCKYDGQIIGNLVCSLQHNIFKLENKCVFCNMWDNVEYFDFCKTDITGFVSDMECSCPALLLDYFQDNDVALVEEANFCGNTNKYYCCEPGAADLSYMISITGGSSELFSHDFGLDNDIYDDEVISSLNNDIAINIQPNDNIKTYVPADAQLQVDVSGKLIGGSSTTIEYGEQNRFAENDDILINLNHVDLNLSDYEYIKISVKSSADLFKMITGNFNFKIINN